MNYVVVDLEMCRVPKSLKRKYSYASETIQIGAVLMDENYNVIDKFMTFVKPKFGSLSKKIIELTGITETDLEDAPGFEEAYEMLMSWLPNEVTVISWSDSDKNQFSHEMAAKNMEISPRMHQILATWIDCQPEFSEKMRMERRYSLTEALIATDICTDGRAHNGLDDAYNTALLYAKMKRENELVLNPYYDSAHNKTSADPLCFGLGDILAAAGF